MTTEIHYKNEQSLESIRAGLSNFNGRPVELQCQDKCFPMGYSYVGTLIVEGDESLSIKSGSKTYVNIDSMIADMKTEAGEVTGIVFKVL